MKKKYLLFAILLFSLVANAHDYYLLPEKWKLTKGENLLVHLYVGDEFTIEEERGVQKYITKRYDWITSKGVKDMLPVYPDSTVPVMNMDVSNTGLGMIAMERSYARIKFTPEKFAAYLKEEGLTDIIKMRETMPVKAEEREKYTRYLKTLVKVGDGTSDIYKRKLGHQLEIILLQDPYNTKIGSEFAAQLLFKGKPLYNGSVEAICKDADGRVHRQVFRSDKKGKLKFKVDNAGAWIIRITHMIPSTDKDADWESFWASYTFGIDGE